MKTMHTAAVLTAIGLALASPAYATVVTNGSDVIYNVSDPVIAQGKSATLDATVEFSNFNFATGLNGSGQTITTVTFTTDVANTTPQGLLSNTDWQSIRLTAFAYNTDPNAVTAGDNSLVYNTFLNKNFPSFNTVDVCLSSGPTCAGGGNGGLSPGGTDSFTESLTFAGLITSFDFGIGANEQLASKWQTGFGSFETGTNPGPTECIPGTPGCVVNPPALPEPTSFALLGTALFGLAAILGRRRRRDNAA